MAVNSKAKGDTYERKIAKKLTEWTGLKFERVPASGGLHWKQDNRVYGDIVTNNPDFPFVIECKCREEWNMDSLINGNKKVEKWWQQVTADAEATGKKPMLIFTRNRQPDYIMLEAAHVQNMVGLSYRKTQGVPFSMITTVCEDVVNVMKLDEFMRYYWIRSFYGGTE